MLERVPCHFGGLRNTGNQYENGGINLIWGLVSSEYENHPNVSTVRQQSLYLPGSNISPLSSQLPIEGDNLPGSEFYAGSMQTAWTVTGGSEVDYSGSTNMGMWARWQTLSQSAETVALIPNLIFTDNAASAVVGTKGVLGPMNAARANVVPIQVTPTIQKIKYHWPFAIPVFIVAFSLLILSVVGVVLAILGKGISILRVHLRHVSPGRIFTTFLYPEPDAFKLKGKEWSERLGTKVVDLSGDISKVAKAIPPETNLPPKTNLKITESEHPDSEDPSTENEGLLNNRGSERAQIPRIARKPLSPTARVSTASGFSPK
jgi:hypothetical protein